MRLVSLTVLLLAVGTSTLAGYYLWNQDLALAIGAPVFTVLLQRCRSAWRAVQSSKQLRHLRSLEAQSAKDLTIHLGDLQIKQAKIVVSCLQGQSLEDWVQFRFGKKLLPPRPDPPEWRQLKAGLLRELQAEAKGRGRLFQNGEKLDMRRVRVQRDRSRRPDTATTYHIDLAKTEYFKFATMSNALDVDVSAYLPKASGRTLREIWSQYNVRELPDVADLPAPACVGTVTVVIAEQDCLVCMLRGRAHFQVGASSVILSTGEPAREESKLRRRVHFVGEGMLPIDRAMDGRPSPDETAYRGLCEELGFSREDVLTDPPRLELKQLGLFLDVRRWQPVFCYLAFARMTFEQIIQRAAAAKDSFESPEIIAREWSIRNKDTRNLLIGTDGRYRLASNHAEVALLLSLLYKDGVSEVAKWLGGQV
jgi:hypothetical protein